MTIAAGCASQPMAAELTETSVSSIQTTGLDGVILRACTEDGCPGCRPDTLPIAPAGPTYDSFERRANIVRAWSACEDHTSEREYTSKLGADWLYSAMGHLAFDDLCPQERTQIPLGATQAEKDATAAALIAARKNGIDERLSRLQNVCPVAHLGSTIDGSDFGLPSFKIEGELDTHLLALVPLVLLYGQYDWSAPGHLSRPANPKFLLSRSYGFLLQFLKDSAGGNNLDIVNRIDMPVGIHDLHAYIPETENHTFNIISARYLTNQLVYRPGAPAPYSGDARYNNLTNGIRDYILNKLQGILKTDFHEYNSKPYARYSLDAIQNLAEFAEDEDIRTASELVLAWSEAKFAMASSLGRRNSPYRRRGDADDEFYTGLVPPNANHSWLNTWNSDAYACWFPLYSGRLDAYTERRLASCGSLIRRAVGSHRIHPMILDLANRKDVAYFQTFSGGPSYYASGADGPVEIYDNEGPFLIAAGGVPTNHGLNAEIFIDGAHVSIGSQNHDSDFGVAVPTVLLPNGVPRVGTNLPLDNRTSFIRFGSDDRGQHQDDTNLCVGKGFACGRMPQIPEALCGSGGCNMPGTAWSFVEYKMTDPNDDFYVVVNNRGRDFGFLEAVPRRRFADLNGGNASLLAFEQRVMQLNGSGWNLVTTSGNGPLPTIPTYAGHYVRVDGSAIDFSVNALLRDNYPIRWSGGPTPPTSARDWNLADGPVQAQGHSTHLELTSPHFPGKCVMDMQDIHHPIWSCPGFEGAPVEDQERGDVHVAPSNGHGFVRENSKQVDWFCLGNQDCQTADVNGDGRDDLVAFTHETGEVWVSLATGSGFGGPGSGKWHGGFCVGNQICKLGDVNGDGKKDLVVFDRGPVGKVFVALSRGTDFFGGQGVWHNGYCVGEQQCEVADVNGDHKADLVVFDNGTVGHVFVALSRGTDFFGGQGIWQNLFCVNGQVCRVGDVNGDGKADILAFDRGAIGHVWVSLSRGGDFYGGTTIWQDRFCVGQQQCEVGDANGDGKADLVVFDREPSGDVWVSLSRGNDFYGGSSIWHPDFCHWDQVCTVGDVTGDGRADLEAFVRH